MPLKLVKPRKGKSPYYTMRGTYLGIYTDRSTGTGDRALAQKILAKRRREIESGKFTDPKAPDFAGAAAAYMKAGGEERFLAPLILHFRTTPLSEIDQSAIDHAADTLYPNASAATRNRQVYSPISAVLKRAGMKKELHRPKGAQGRELTHWLQPEQAFALFLEADKLDCQFGIFLRFLCYTGERLTAALKIQVSDIEFDQSLAYVRKGKNGNPRGVYLPPDLVERMKAHPKGIERTGKFFTFSKSGYLYNLLDDTCRAAKVNLPSRVAFHVFCHTWGTWMRRTGMDARGLVGTGRWDDPKSTFRYTHVVVSEESRKAALLPVEKKKVG